MDRAQKQLKIFKGILGTFSNPRPRDVDTDEGLNAHIDKVVGALDAMRPQRAEVTVTPDSSSEEPSEGTSSTDEGQPPDKKRKRKQSDPNRMHTGGLDRNG